jgi:uncharacterized protein
MILEGEWHIPADRRTVWAALNDPQMLKRCIPGCQSLDKLSDTEFASTVRASVGPVSASFRATITLTDIDPGRGYTMVGEGKGGAAGFARGKAKVDLEDEGDGTRLGYRADITIGGKLAQVGSRLIQGTARQMSERFFGCLTEQLGAAGDAAAGRPSPPAAPGWPAARKAMWAVAAILAVAAIAWWLAG